jgi:hypothetical protein
MMAEGSFPLKIPNPQSNPQNCCFVRIAGILAVPESDFAPALGGGWQE